MLDCAKPFPVHLFWDRAIDMGKTDLSLYLEEKDPDHLVWRPGEMGMAFWCRPIDTLTAERYLSTSPFESIQRGLAFRASVIRVEHCDGRLEDGASRPAGFVPERVAQAGADNLESLDSPWLMTDTELKLFDFATRQEVGEVALRRAFLPRGIVGGYRLPPSSQRLLEAMRALYAVQALSALETQTNSPPPGDETSADDAPPAEPGDVTATASEPPGEGSTTGSTPTPS